MFKLAADFQPTGDQPKAIEQLVKGLNSNVKDQVLLGVTGSGKTYTVANVIEQVQKPTLVLAHNKTLAAQLCAEFREFFPENAVEYFVSYYDYYQPEAYLPASDTYIEKDASINEEIDRLRHSATKSLFTRSDVIIVSSVSCIYGLGEPEEYYKKVVVVEKGKEYQREKFILDLVNNQYDRNDIDLHRGTFRVKGDVIEIVPAYEQEIIKISFFGDEVDEIAIHEQVSGRIIKKLESVDIFPGKHYLTSENKLAEALKNIEEEMLKQEAIFKKDRKVLEAHRIRQKTMYDLEMIKEIGYCNGIENYSRHLEGRAKGAPPATLLKYFPEDFLMVVDESHVTIPQVRGMYAGDQARKDCLIENGFRLPSAKDNRPLNFNEFENNLNQTIYISATPGDYELEKAEKKNVVEQLIRPTWLVDPQVEIKPVSNQVDDLIDQAKERVEAGDRILVTTLTKRMAEDLTLYLKEAGLKVNYLHSDIKALERIDILKDLRIGKFDVLVGINLLREGLDLPEVSLVAILDADKEGFLRAERSLIQTIGRAARNANGKVVLYADKMTDSLKKAISETNRRREIQLKYNKDNKLSPVTIIKDVKTIATGKEKGGEAPLLELKAERITDPQKYLNYINELRVEMESAAANLEFEKAAIIRDKLTEIEESRS